MSPNAFPHNQLNLLIDRADLAEAAIWLPSDAQLTQWVLAVLSSTQSATVNAAAVTLQDHLVELSVSCVHADHMRTLNAQYRGKDTETNVLSFPAGMPVLPAAQSGGAATLVLGDVVVCPEVLVREAKQQSKTIEHHWAHMVIHSVLHLSGFDHLSELSAEAMESLEIQILSTLGMTNPYLAVSAKQS